MTKPTSNSDLHIWILNQGRLRHLKWDHPWSADEAALNGLLIRIVAGEQDVAEMVPVLEALEAQRQKDAAAYRTNKDAYMEAHYAHQREMRAMWRRPVVTTNAQQEELIPSMKEWKL